MIHRGLLFWSVVAVATAVGLFAVKYKVQDLEEKIDRTNQKIIESQKATHILRVEWAHLNEAERIQRLAEKHLKLEPASIKQVIRFGTLKADGKVDSAKPIQSPATRPAPLPPPHVRATTSPRRTCPVVVASQRRPAAPRRPPHPLQGVPPDPRRPLDRPLQKSQHPRVRLATARAPQPRSTKSSRVMRGSSVRLWRKSGSPEPAAAPPRGGRRALRVAQDRLKGDAQETARQRLVIASAIFSLAFVAVALRMGYVSLLRDGAEPTQRVAARGGSIQSERADIVDRNGVVLATSVPVMSAFVNPRLLLDPQDAARKIASALPELKYEELKEQLDADKTFMWIKRGLSPREHDLVNRLGIPGLEFQAEERRIYPQGTAAAHILGYASVDNAGLAGIERFFDQQLQSGETLQLSIDLRLQRMVEQELVRAVQKFSAIGATGIVMDATNGEILAMASLPTFDPNKAKTITNEALFNRATLGVYEQGSTFKIFNTAMALDSGKVTLTSIFDARRRSRSTASPSTTTIRSAGR